MSKGIFRTIGKIAGVVATVASVIPGGQIIAAAAAAVAIGASALGKPKSPATSANATDRLSVSMDPRAPRKFVLGRTAMATDIRDQEFSNNQEYLHRFIVTASHKATAYEEIWFDDKKAWSTTGGVTSDFAGYLTVTPILEGSAANAINLSSRMGATRRYTGLAYIYLRFKLTGNSKKAESPFAQSIPSRVTIIGKGAPTYDPRLDSTVAGGSGAHRAADQTTWAWNDAASRNPALQLLWYLLGWRIKNPVTNEWRLAVGKGIPASRIDLASFITAANLCDEPVTLAAGGTQPRYRSDCVFSESDATGTVLDQLKASMNAELDDVDGKIRITVLHNDLATPIADFNDDDILSGFSWDQTAPLDETYNVVRGTFIDPSTTSLYQSVEYPEVRIDSADGIDRVETVDFQTVQDASQAQRLVKQRIARMLYSGRFTATFSYRAWKVQKNDVVRLTFGALGWTNKLFRVVETAVQVDGQVPMVLQVENANIYLWDRDERPAIQPVQPTSYDPYLNPIYQDVVEPKYADGVTIDELRPAEAGATAGASPEERDLLAELDADVAQAEIDIAAAQQTIADLQTDAAATKAELEGDIADLQTITGQIQAEAAETASDLQAAQATIAAQGTAITQAKADILANASSIQTVSTTVGNQGAAITTLQQTASGQAGQISTLQQTVATQGGSISTNATAITNLQGSVSTLSQTVSTQGGSITTMQQSITTLQGSVSTLSTTVSTQGASITLLQTTSTTHTGQLATLTTQVTSGVQNLLPNGDFSNGMTDWTGSGAGGWAVTTTSRGQVCSTSATGNPQLRSPRFLVTVGATITAGVVAQDTRAANKVYMQLRYEDAAGANLQYRETAAFTDTLGRKSATGVVPSGAVYCRLWFAASGSSSGTVEISNVTVVSGSVDVPTANPTATITQTLSTLSTATTQLATLSTTVSTQGGSITTLQSSMTTAQGNISTLQSTVSAQGASITQNATALSTLQGTVSTLSTTVSAQGTSITNLQSASSTQAGQIATLTTNLGTTNSNVSLNAQAITTANQNIATLTGTVTTQGSSITQAQTAITTLQASTATLTTQVRAGGNPNLLLNSSFENGMTGWNMVGAAWTASASSAWGSYAGSGSALANNASAYLYRDVDIEANAQYTLTADIGQFITSGTGRHYVQIEYINASGSSLGTYPGTNRDAGPNFDPTGVSREALKVTAPLAPAGAVKARIYIVWVKVSGTVSSMHVRQIKFERGTLATPYSQEASVVSAYSTLSTLTTQYASLSTTVSTQGVTITSQQTAITTINGNITTIFGQYVLNVTAGGLVAGIKLANNGSASSLRFQSDVVTFESSSGAGERTEYSNGNWRVYNSAGTLKVQWGVNI